MKEILETLGIDRALLIAGFVGSVSGITGSKKPLIAKVGSVILGIGVSVYTTPLACELLDVVNEKSKLGVAVAIGYLGIQGIQKFVISKLNKDGDN